MNRSLNLGMRMICLVLCLVCLLSAILPAAADQTTPEEQPVAQSMTTVVRKSASASSISIGQLEEGTAVTVLSEHGDFYRVDCYDMVGYIAKTQIAHKDDDKYYVNCDPASQETRWLNYTDHAEVFALRNSLEALASKQIGSRYVRGGTRPGAFDCSGLTYYLYGKHNIGLHRTATQQLQDGILVPKDGMQVGDLIFFHAPGRPDAVSHVGIYVGDNQMIHSGSKGVARVNLDVDYYQDYFLCARRIVNVDTAKLEQQPVVARITSDFLTANSVSGRTVN